MSGYSRRAVLSVATVASVAALAASIMALAAADDASGLPADQQEFRAPPLSSLTSKQRELLDGFDPLQHRLQDGVLVSDLNKGRRAVLTLHPGLQEHMTKVLERHQVPYGALVALEPRSGRVLAYVSHSSAAPGVGDLVRDPTPPSASVFKLVTAAALVDAGIGADTRVCYGGGFRKLVRADLLDNPARDRSCATLSEALGGSLNTIFAKLADRHLDSSTLTRYAAAFGYGHALPFDVRTRPSPGVVPDDRLEFARTAAGFWHMHMSPLHGALIAATIANGGVMPAASMVSRVVDADGKVLDTHESRAYRSVIPRSTARVVGQMMRRTVSHGTARSAFHDLEGRPFLPGIEVAGKTGSLSTERPYRAYSWWVGFAPADAPTIAVAALVINEPRWRVKGSYVAREALRYYLVQAARQRKAPQSAPSRTETAELL